MQEIFIKYNPYKIKTEVKKNNKTIGEKSDFYNYLEKPFQEWVHKIPNFVSEEINSKEYKIIFHGTKLDYSDLKDELEKNKNNDVNYNLEYREANEYLNKIKEIENLFQKIQQTPLKELQSEELKQLFENTKNNLMEVNIFATMSAGKSTLINALLGKELMPVSVGACTGIVSRIQDDDTVDGFSAKIKYKNGEIYRIPENITLKDMEQFNENKEIEEVYIKGDIPFLAAKDMSLMLVDTPGINNAHNEEHGKITAKSLEMDSKMIVLFVMDANNLSNNDQIKFFKKIAENMKKEGKQSRERFLFVVNKADIYVDPDKYNEDFIEERVINEVKKMLETYSIKDPTIILLSAKTALEIKNRDLRKEDKEQELEDPALSFNEYPHMHLEKYSNLTKEAENIIKEELKNAKDMYQEALIHTGIRSLEEYIKNYLEKYSRPLKIKNLVDTFRAKVDLAKLTEEIKQKIIVNKDSLEKYKEVVENLSKERTIENINEEYKTKIEKIDIVKSVAEELKKETKKITDLFTNTIEKELNRFGTKIEESYEEYIRSKIEDEAKKVANTFKETVDRTLEKGVKNYSETIVLEYFNKINSITKKVGLAELEENFTVYKNYSLNKIIEVAKTEVNKEIEITEASWLNKITFGLFGKGEVRKTYVKKDDLMQTLIAIESGLLEEEKKVIDFVENKQKELKIYFFKQFEKVDEKLNYILSELKEASLSAEKAEEIYEKSSKIGVQLDEIIKELENILEI